MAKKMMAAWALAGMVGGAAQAGVVTLRAQRIATGLSQPVFLGSAPGDTRRLFVLEQHTGRIRLIKDGVMQLSPFLNVSGLSSNSGSERGLLGLTFHPDYVNNGRFYIYYTSQANGSTVVARYNVSANPDLADSGSAQIVFTHSQPFANHNAGMLAFGADGYLYIGLGDGGSGGDPGNRAQNPGVLLGKMLRIDVDGGVPYAIPADNPFEGPGDPLDEIWALGLRNPWRYSFDRLTGDLYIADVGQNLIEEVNFQSADSPGGENYGWRLMEGNNCFNPPEDCNPGGLTLPIHTYTHAQGCSVTGGYVYRGSAIPALRGTYFFADYCAGTVWSFRYTGGAVTEFTNRSAQLAVGIASPINNVSSFGEDARGELYIVDHDGDIFRIVDAFPPDCDGALATGGAARGAEDCNGNGLPDACEAQADFNQDGVVDLNDFPTFSVCYGLSAPVPGVCPAHLFTACDLVANGTINLDDFSAFSVSFGACP